MRKWENEEIREWGNLEMRKWGGGYKERAIGGD